MNKELVIVVPTEVAAYEVVKALEALEDKGTIGLYSSTVVAKMANGAIDIRNPNPIRGHWRTVLGLTAGALIGLLAGPLGAAAGAAIGGAAGFGGDLAYSGFEGAFVQEVGASLRPGAYAVVASVWEDWTVPVDAAVAPFASAVFRQSTDHVVVARIRAEWQSVMEEQEHLDTEIAHATGAAKAKLEAQRNELRAKQAAERERLHKRATRA